MSSGYIYLLIALICFAGIGILHKVGDRLQCQPLAIVSITMAAGCIISLFKVCSEEHEQAITKDVVIVSIIFGICAAIALWAFQVGIKYGHLATSWLILNMSVAITTSLSVIMYDERISINKGIGLLSMFAAVILLWIDRVHSEKQSPKSEV
jgi:drug/metabolite transporter (DMT)-like permease